MDGQRSNDGDDGETSEDFGVPDCFFTERRRGQWENMREGRSTLSSCGVGEEY